MTKAYRKIAHIQAERFGASAHQVSKYPISFDVWDVPDETYGGLPVKQSGWRLESSDRNYFLQFGDWIATDVDGEHWVIDDAIFRKTYEEVVEDE